MAEKRLESSEAGSPSEETHVEIVSALHFYLLHSPGACKLFSAINYLKATRLFTFTCK